MDEDATWCGDRPRPMRLFGGDPDPRTKKGTVPHPILADVYCGQTAGWMKTPLGKEVDLGRGHIVLHGDPAAQRKGHSSPLFSAHVYCGHDRPSQLLLSSC